MQVNYFSLLSNPDGGNSIKEMLLSGFIFTNMDILGTALGQGIVPAVIVVIYLIIVKVIDSRKDSTSAKITKDLTNSIITISNYLDNITKNVIAKDKEKCEVAIENGFKSFALHLITFVNNTVIHNHIEENKDVIIQNVKNLINGEYYNIHAVLANYVIKNTNVSTLLKADWMSDIEAITLCVIYNNKLDVNSKITTFNNQITLKFKTYTNYLINNAFK